MFGWLTLALIRTSRSKRYSTSGYTDHSLIAMGIKPFRTLWREKVIKEYPLNTVQLEPLELAIGSPFLMKRGSMTRLATRHYRRRGDGTGGTRYKGKGWWHTLHRGLFLQTPLGDRESIPGDRRPNHMKRICNNPQNCCHFSIYPYSEYRYSLTCPRSRRFGCTCILIFTSFFYSYRC